MRNEKCLAEEACTGFGQDRVNFQRNPGRHTAGRADPTWPNRTGYSIPCAVMLGSGWGLGGDGHGGSSVAAREHAAAAGGESCSLCSILFCVFSLSVSLLSLFPLEQWSKWVVLITQRAEWETPVAQEFWR